MTPIAASLSPRLAEVLGTGRVVTDRAALAEYEVDGQRPSAALRPDSATEIAEILRFASTERLAVIASGGRTKLGIGMPPRQYDLALDASAMNRVLAYDPKDLTLGVEPGVRYADLDRCLREQKQFLPLAPAFAERATMGGIVAAGADTPLRYGYGTARDYLLGVEFVTGEGTASKSGGRVVKNVTGYDLHKLLVGSLGTLAIITRVNFRTFPLPREARMFAVSFAEAQSALKLCRAIAKSPLQPRLVEVIDPGTARLFASRCAAHLPADHWSVIVEAAGHRDVVERHRRELEHMARAAQATEFVACDESRQAELFAFLQEFPNVALKAFPRAAIFRIAVLPSAIGRLLEQAQTVSARHALGEAILIRAAGIVYIAFLPPHSDPGAPAKLVSACRELMSTCQSASVRPRIEWCPQEVKRDVGVWPAPGDEQKIAERLKKVFDPQGILAPGRFQGGI